MSRLLIHVEGETEETFVNEVLAPHLYHFGYSSVSARLLGNSRRRSRRGGIGAWHTVRTDILNHLREDPGSLSTTIAASHGERTRGLVVPSRRRSVVLSESER